MQVTQEDDLRRTMRSGAGAAPRESPSQLYQRQRNNPFQETDKHRVVAMLSSQEGSKKEGKTKNKQTCWQLKTSRIVTVSRLVVSDFL